MITIKVDALLKDEEFELGLTLLAGKEGVGRPIDNDRIQKPGMAFTGYTDFMHSRRVQVLGNSEISYLWHLPPAERAPVLRHITGKLPACIIVTKGLQVPEELTQQCEENGTPLLSTSMLSGAFISKVQAFLAEKLAPRTALHAVLVDVFGIGVLILGKSGIGKSECALDLIMRNHRLVADDVVEIKRKGPDVVFGSGNEIIKHHMEIRGLGILNIKDLFGVASVRDRKRIEVVVELVEWSDDAEYERIGIDERRYTLLDVDIPMLTVPVRPGRNITTIIEVAARNQLLKLQGHHSARAFQDKLNQAMAQAGNAPRRMVGDDVE